MRQSHGFDVLPVFRVLIIQKRRLSVKLICKLEFGSLSFRCNLINLKRVLNSQIADIYSIFLLFFRMGLFEFVNSAQVLLQSCGGPFLEPLDLLLQLIIFLNQSVLVRLVLSSVVLNLASRCFDENLKLTTMCL